MCRSSKARRDSIRCVLHLFSALCALWFCEEIFFPWQLYDRELFILCGASKHYVAVGFAVSSWRAAQCTFSPQACVLLKSTFCLERKSFLLFKVDHGSDFCDRSDSWRLGFCLSLIVSGPRVGHKPQHHLLRSASVLALFTIAWCDNICWWSCSLQQAFAILQRQSSDTEQ